MASEVTSRSRAQSLPRSSSSKPSPLTRLWNTAKSTRLKTSDKELDTVSTYKRLKEPLLDTSHDGTITPVSEPPPPSGEIHSAPEEDTGSVRFRKRAKAWRRGMGLPRSRKRQSTVADQFIDSSKNTPHYVKHCASDNLLARARLRILRGVESPLVKLLSLLVLFLYVGLVIAHLILYHTATVSIVADEVLQLLDLIFVAYFSVEAGLRIVGQGKVYFRRWFEVVDLAVVVLSTVLTVAFVIVVDNTDLSLGVTTIVLSCGFGPYSSLRFIVLGRILRLFFWSRVMDEQRSIITYVRSKVSQNKRRYVDENFNLDLTYVTDRVIAMSFPSSGSQSLYRNSIQEVGKFLDKKHFGHYRVYNLCSEREYDTSYFHNQVQRILIDDHNVPKFTDMVDFCEDALMWMEGNVDNVIVVHCKGGKGRTGMMISAWLVRSGLFEQARDSLEYFTLRRTDKSRGTKSQGVDTPSQSRYVEYYQRLIAVMKRNLPPPVALRITTLTLHGISGLGRGDGSDWRFEIYLAADEIFECSLDSLNEKISSVGFERNTNTLEVVFNPSKPVVLVDDVKFKFYTTNRSIPAGNDKCHFYFWFHTTFIENYKLYLDRKELDNLHKSKLQRYYPIGFGVELAFERSTDFSGTYSIIDSASSHILVD